MHRAWRFAAIAAATMLAPAPAVACSLAPWYESTERFGAAEFIGRAAADTLEAGAGAMRARAGEGHFGFARSRRIHGQVVRVTRLATFTAPALRAAVDRAGGRVVLVPWDYGPDCRDVIWPGSARWMAPGTEGLFAAGLRDRAHWVAGIPTFDVVPGPWTPYGATMAPDPRGAGRMEPHLTATELLELRERLPALGELERRAESVAGSLEAWAQANPELARRAPAAGILARVRRELAVARFRRRPVPYAGTYRVTLTLLDRRHSFVFYARTLDRPAGPLDSDELEGDGRGRGNATGMWVPGCAGRSPRALPLSKCPREDGRHPQGEITIMDSVARSADGAERRAGKIVFHGLADRRWVRGGAFRRRLSTIWPDMSSSSGWNLVQHDTTVGSFTAHPDGRVTFGQVVSRRGKPVLAVRAERISLRTFNDY